MKKRKICVYAISKNEDKFAERWYNSMKEADEVYVLDTGSTDKTVEILNKLGAKVIVKKVEPWRFDTARNESLLLIPKDTDICVCTDLDEVFKEGWRNELEKNWNNNTTRARYTYNWSIDKNEKPLVSFYQEKIHSLKDHYWKNPVHEIIVSDKVENYINIPQIVLNHYPDSSKSRSSYLPLLELSIKEDPNNDRNMHYLGREYMYYNKNNEAIDTLIKHLSMPNATWKDERSASMRFISRCYIKMKRYEEAKMWLDKAIKETPYLRDPLIEKALLEYSLDNFDEVEKLLKKALKIKINNKTYINEVFTFDHTAYDLLSIIYYKKNDTKKALFYLKKALKISPDNERLLYNYKCIKNE